MFTFRRLIRPLIFLQAFNHVRAWAGIVVLSSVLLSCAEQEPVAPAAQIEQTPMSAAAQIETDAELMARAQGIHERVITLDTQVTLPMMQQGELDVAWFIVYTGQGELTEEGYAAAYANAMDKFSAIERLTKEIAPGTIELAYSSDDVRRITAAGKKVAMIGIENAYPLGLDISNVKKFHELGGRYMSLAHNGHSQFADSNTGEADGVWLHNGLSERGRQAIGEMNRWGIMIDISHPSTAANMQTIELSVAPVIASHSSARGLYDHSRNLNDEELMAVKANGGVVQAVAFRGYVDGDKHSLNRAALLRLQTSIAGTLGYELLDAPAVRELDEAARAAYDSKMTEINMLAGPRIASEVDQLAAPVDVKDFVDHIDYMVNLIGIEHVGISSDFDGGGGVTGWNDASETFNVTLELVRRAYTEEQIAALWSGNLLRVLDDVQRIAADIQSRG